jgi:hypothetical protein
MSADTFLVRPGRPEDQDAALEVENAVWAPFHWDSDDLPGWEYDPLLWVVAEREGRIVASADGCRMHWDGAPAGLPRGGWMEVLGQAPAALAEGAPWGCALGTSILPEAQGHALSGRMLVALVAQARIAGLRGLLAPARPTARARMPELSIDDYAAVRLPDGRHFDPWLRVHERIGGTIIATCSPSMRVSAPIGDWERWLGEALPATGRLLIRGAIGYLEIREGVGTLTEDSVWVLHQTAPAPAGS